MIWLILLALVIGLLIALIMSMMQAAKRSDEIMETIILQEKKKEETMEGSCQGYCHSCFAKEVHPKIYDLVQQLQSNLDEEYEILEDFCLQLFKILEDDKYEVQQLAAKKTT